MKVAKFEEYLKSIIILKVINEATLICGLCLLLSNVFDRLLIGDTYEDIATEKTFMMFLDEQNESDHSEDDDIYDLIELVMLKSREPTDYIADFSTLT